MKNTRAIFLSMIIIGLCGLVGMASGYLYKSTAPTTTKHTYRYVPPTSPRPTPTPQPPLEQLPFESFHIKPNEAFAGTFKLPTEILKLSDADVIKTRCTPTYWIENGHASSEVKMPENSPIVQKIFDTLGFAQVEQEIGFSVCETENRQLFVPYSQSHRDAKFITVAEFDSNFHVIQEIQHTVRGPYYGCRKIITMTPEFTYFLCGGGDGGGGVRDVVRVSNSNPATVKTLLTCDLSGDDVDCTYY